MRPVFSGLSQRIVATLHHLSLYTFYVLVRYAQHQGYSGVEDLSHLSEEKLVGVLSKQSFLGRHCDQSYVISDYEYVHQELSKGNATLALLWEEYVEKHLQEVRDTSPKPNFIATIINLQNEKVYNSFRTQTWVILASGLGRTKDCLF